MGFFSKVRTSVLWHLLTGWLGVTVLGFFLSSLITSSTSFAITLTPKEKQILAMESKTLSEYLFKFSIIADQKAQATAWRMKKAIRIPTLFTEGHARLYDPEHFPFAYGTDWGDSAKYYSVVGPVLWDTLMGTINNTVLIPVTLVRDHRLSSRQREYTWKAQALAIVAKAIHENTQFHQTLPPGHEVTDAEVQSLTGFMGLYRMIGERILHYQGRPALFSRHLHRINTEFLKLQAWPALWDSLVYATSPRQLRAFFYSQLVEDFFRLVDPNVPEMPPQPPIDPVFRPRPRLFPTLGGDAPKASGESTEDPKLWDALF